MKYWLSHLPLELWVDCYRYPWITREQMGRIVDLIGNHKYGEYMQFYLHGWGKRTLKPIHFYQQKHPKFKAIPQTPMPGNIRAFECIRIKNFLMQKVQTPNPNYTSPSKLPTELQQWIDENRKEMNGNRQIRIRNPTIGLLDAVMDALENADEDQQKPSTSKKARIS